MSDPQAPIAVPSTTEPIMIPEMANSSSSRSSIPSSSPPPPCDSLASLTLGANRNELASSVDSDTSNTSTVSSIDARALLRARELLDAGEICEEEVCSV